MPDVTPSERVDAIMRELDLAIGHYFLGGSSGLALRDIRHVGDIDVGVPTRYWFLLYETREWGLWTPDTLDDGSRCDPPYLIREVNGTEVHVFHAWRWRGKEETDFNDFNLVFREGIEIVKGWPCIKLPWLLRQKVDAVVNCYEGGYIRQKDVTDISLIVEALGEVATR